MSDRGAYSWWAETILWQVTKKTKSHQQLERKNENDANSSLDNPDSAADRGPANMAIQHQLGILPQQWFGSHLANCLTGYFASLEIGGSTRPAVAPYPNHTLWRSGLSV